MAFDTHLFLKQMGIDFMMFSISSNGNICIRVFLYMEVVGLIISALSMVIGNSGVISDTVT